jgi:hypothetical protein
MRRTGLGIVVAVALLLAGACGDGEDEAQTLEVSAETLQRAASTTLTDASTGRFEGMATFTGLGVDGRSETTEQDASGEYDAEAEAVHTVTTSDDGDGESIEVGGVAYRRGYPFTGDDLGLELGADEWIRFDAVPGTGERPPISPAELLADLEDFVGEVVEVGEDEVRGVDTTQLHGTYEVHDPEADASVSFDGATQEVDVWVDDDGLVRRLDMDFRADGLEMHVQSTVEFFDFGATVDIVAPATSTPFEELGSAPEDAALGFEVLEDETFCIDLIEDEEAYQDCLDETLAENDPFLEEPPTSGD